MLNLPIPLNEKLNLTEISKFLKIQEIKFVSGTKPTKKESFVFYGLVDVLLYFNVSDELAEFLDSGLHAKFKDLYRKTRHQNFFNANKCDFKVIRKHFYNFCFFGCNYFNY